MARKEWEPRFDFEPAGARRLRDQEMKRWSDEHLLVAVSHFPSTGFGYVEADGDAWRWVPSAKRVRRTVFASMTPRLESLGYGVQP